MPKKIIIDTEDVQKIETTIDFDALALAELEALEAISEMPEASKIPKTPKVFPDKKENIELSKNQEIMHIRNIFSAKELKIYDDFYTGKLDKPTIEQSKIISKITDALMPVTVDETDTAHQENEQQEITKKLEQIEQESKKSIENFKNIDEFPLQVLPENLQQYAKDVVGLIRSTPSVNYPVSLLFPAAGSLMTDITCEVQKGYSVVPNFMVGIIGTSGKAKSPCMEKVRDLLSLQQDRYFDEYKREVEEYEKAEEEIEIKPKKKPKAKKDEAKKDEPEVKKDEAKKDEFEANKPKVKLIYPELKLTSANDITREAVISKLLASKGLCLAFDELSAFQGGFNQYKSGKSGNDKETYMTLLDGREYIATRKTKGRNGRESSEILRAPRLSIMGCVTPDKLSQLISKDLSDGFEERYILVADNAPITMQETNPMDEENLKKCQELFCSLKKLKGTMTLTEEARVLYGKYYDKIMNAVSNIKDLNVHIEGFTSKMGNTIIRVAMVLNALNGRGLVINEATMQDAILVSEFFRRHTIGVYLSLQPLPMEVKPNKVLAWATKKNIQVISVRTICNLKVGGLTTAKLTREVFEELVTRELAVWTRPNREIRLL